MKAIRIHETGDVDKLKCEELPEPRPGDRDVLVKLDAAGVNFIDIYFRTGLYKAALPFTLGSEGAGVVTAVGARVAEFHVGDRVAYAGVPGSYAEYVSVPAGRLIRVPEKVDTKTAAAVMLQGMTAHYLTRSTYPLKSGDTALVHAAAGGVGLLLVQIAKRLGARVFGTVSTEQKARLASAAGADAVILYTKQDFEAEVKRLTDGRGVDVVYDSVGQSTFAKGLNSLAPRGYMVLFGYSSGPVAPLDPNELGIKGSLFLTRCSMVHYTLTRDELLQRANEVLDWVASGELKVRVGATFPLKDAGQAQRAMAARQTTGKVLLLP